MSCEAHDKFIRKYNYGDILLRSNTGWRATYTRTIHRDKARKSRNILARDRLPNPCEDQRTSATVFDGGRRNKTDSLYSRSHLALPTAVGVLTMPVRTKKEA